MLAECHMADRPSKSASRVGRPRMRSPHQIPCVPSSKVGGPRSKSVYKPKVNNLAKKAPAKQKLVRPIPPLDQDVVVVIDPDDQEFPLPADQLPDLPLVEPYQIPNPQLNLPNQPLDLPTEEPDQLHLPPNQPNQLNLPNQPKTLLIINQIYPTNLRFLPLNNPNQPNQPNIPPNLPPNLPANPPDPMANQWQLNGSYFEPEFSAEPE